MDHLYIFATVLFTVYGQLIIKWRMSLLNTIPEQLGDKLFFFINLLFDPFVFSGFFAAFLASIFWMIAISKFKLSYAFPFTSLSFVFIMLASAFFFKEALNLYKVIGIILVLLGIIIGSQS